ncbi:hypothetical protein [Ideonella sp. BN130291]|uniref:hypothetical protein n=1 Tax=Ideonella sp. BN130291 TaxID=3112940 RepID=UPI002E263BEE|nr:hypothetical protein [Ideonella sp. BN130291]
MLHPNQFKVNDAWLAFQLNDEPIHTERDGDFNFFALMDAASCFILSSTPVAATQGEPAQLEVKRLLKEGQAHKKQWPKTLFVPTEQVARFLIAEAEQLGIGVVRVAEVELLPFIGEAQEGFRERFGGQGTR